MNTLPPRTPEVLEAQSQCLSCIGNTADTLTKLISLDPARGANALTSHIVSVLHHIDGPFHNGAQQLLSSIKPCSNPECDCHVRSTAILQSIITHIMPQVREVASRPQHSITLNKSNQPIPGGVGLPAKPIPDGHCRIKVSRPNNMPGYMMPNQNDAWVRAWRPSPTPSPQTPNELDLCNIEALAGHFTLQQAETEIIPHLRNLCTRIELIKA